MLHVPCSLTFGRQVRCPDTRRLPACRHRAACCAGLPGAPVGTPDLRCPRNGRAVGQGHRPCPPEPEQPLAPSLQPPSAHLWAAYCLQGRPPGRVKPPIFRFVREHGGVCAASYSREGGLRSYRQPGYRPTHLFSMYPAGKPGAGFRQSPHRRCPHSGCRLPLLLQVVCLLRRGRPGRPVRLPVMRLHC